MIHPSITTLIPTMGRETLEDSLESVLRQTLDPDDEVVVIGDGWQFFAAELTAVYEGKGLRIRYLSHGPTRNYGNAQRTFGLRVCHGSHVAFLDDDDVFGPEAFTQIRKAIRAQPHVGLFMFKTVSPWGEVVWTEEGVFEQGNICTVQMVVRNKRPFPPWPLRQGGNVGWAREMARGREVSWRPEITTICRPVKRWWE